MRCTSKAPLLARNGLGNDTSQRLPRSEVVWATTVKTSNSSLAGGGVRIRQGRTFAVMPKSTIQISPGFAVGILGLLVIHFLKHGVGRFVEKMGFVVPVHFLQALSYDGPLLVC